MPKHLLLSVEPLADLAVDFTEAELLHREVVPGLVVVVPGYGLFKPALFLIEQGCNFGGSRSLKHCQLGGSLQDVPLTCLSFLH